MIRKISIAVNLFLENYLPIHKRLPIRLDFLKLLHSTLDLISTEFIQFRNGAIVKAYVSGETKSIEWYLNNYFNTGNAITIDTAGISGLGAGITTIEPTAYQSAGIESSEPTAFVANGYLNEMSIYGTKTFIVNVPAAMVGFSAQIEAIVNSYRAAGKTFKIVLY